MHDEFARFRAQMENAIEAVYRLGLEHGDSAAIARILKAAGPNANGTVVSNAPKLPRAPSAPTKAPGEATHKLIEAVLREKGKATPTEIQSSPANKTGIKRDAIRNAIRRGNKPGRYVSVGKGRYSLGKTEAQK